MKKIILTKEEEILKNKKVDKATKWGFLLGWIVACGIFLIFVLLLFIQPFFRQDLSNTVLDSSFKIVANSWEDSSVVNSLSYLCSLKEDNISKVYCTYNFIYNNVDFNYHDRGTNILNKPEEVFSKESVCRDVSVLFKSVMNKMNIENIYIHEPDHIYNKVFLENDVICLVDITNNFISCN
jgi:hypothetical protein